MYVCNISMMGFSNSLHYKLDIKAFWFHEMQTSPSHEIVDLFL